MDSSKHGLIAKATIREQDVEVWVFHDGYCLFVDDVLKKKECSAKDMFQFLVDYLKDENATS